MMCVCQRSAEPRDAYYRRSRGVGFAILPVFGNPSVFVIPLYPDSSGGFGMV